MKNRKSSKDTLEKNNRGKVKILMRHSGAKGWMPRAKPQKSLKARRFSSSATGAAFHLVLSLSSDRADCMVRKAPLPKGTALMLPLPFSVPPCLRKHQSRVCRALPLPASSLAPCTACRS